MTPAAESLTRQLLSALDEEAALTEQLAVVRKTIVILTADAAAAMDAPLVIAPWTRWNPGEAR